MACKPTLKGLVYMYGNSLIYLDLFIFWYAYLTLVRIYFQYKNLITSHFEQEITREKYSRSGCGMITASVEITEGLGCIITCAWLWMVR